MKENTDKKVTVLLGDVKEEKVAEIRALMGDKWDDRMLTAEAFEVQDPKYKKDSLSGLLDGLLEALLGGKSSVSEEAFLNMEEEEKEKVRKVGLTRGHDCYNCEKTDCVLHPDFVRS